MFAIFTPFCSCSSVPIFLSLVKLRVPFASAICFLAVSPLVNEYLVVLMPKYFGFPVTIAYIICGIATGMIAGWTLEKLGFAKYIEPAFAEEEPDFPEYKNFTDRIKFGTNEGSKIVKRLWIWILAGVALGVILNIYVSDESITKIVNAGGIFSVPIAALVGAPIYGSCAGQFTTLCVCGPFGGRHVRRTAAVQGLPWSPRGLSALKLDHVGQVAHRDRARPEIADAADPGVQLHFQQFLQPRAGVGQLRGGAFRLRWRFGRLVGRDAAGQDGRDADLHVPVERGEIA